MSLDCIFRFEKTMLYVLQSGPCDDGAYQEKVSDERADEKHHVEGVVKSGVHD